jgi:hypothetical protein
LPRETGQFLGYAPRVDVLLEREDGTKRLWIKFEVSRADPVANHVKFATSHLFQPQPSTDSFVAMISPHVARGRRNLAANTILLMRRIGMNAFQTVLFPHFSGQDIKRLNHLGQTLLSDEGLDVRHEVERVFLVTEPFLQAPEFRVHFVGDILDVMLNVQRWNKDISSIEGKHQWGRRTITYFVYDPRSRDFAPSKFCAFLAIPVLSCINHEHRTAVPMETSGMNIEFYASVENGDRKFDGGRARMHLINHLGMIQKSTQQDENILSNFDRWLARHTHAITIHPAGPAFILPPTWFL